MDVVDRVDAVGCPTWSHLVTPGRTESWGWTGGNRENSWDGRGVGIFEQDGQYLRELGVGGMDVVDRVDVVRCPTWSHLVAPGRTWSHLVAPSHTRSSLVALGQAWGDEEGADKHGRARMDGRGQSGPSQLGFGRRGDRQVFFEKWGYRT